MAVYRNRIVSIVGPTYLASIPQNIIVQYDNGSTEAVSITSIQFTTDEKKTLIKNSPSVYEGINTISDEDISMIRQGRDPSDKPKPVEAKPTKAPVITE